MVVKFAILIVGMTFMVAVPVAVPKTALTNEDAVKVKFLPPEEICVTTPGNVKVVAPAAIVAEPLAEV